MIKKMISIIAFGNGTMANNHVKLKGHRVDLTDILYFELKKKQKNGKKIVALVDEYRASKICHHCNQMSFTQAFCGLHSALTCQGCGMMWNRDISASKSIYNLFERMVAGEDLPAPFKRQ